jgi:CheY-like chemotaxis protein
MKKILLVNDHEGILLANKQLLRGFNCDLARNGVEALDMLNQSGPYNLMITDYHMPLMDGITLIEKINGFYPEMPRIMISGTLYPKDITKLNDLGVSHLDKPYSTAEFLGLVRRVLRA